MQLNRKILTILVFVFVVILFTIVLYMYNKPHRNLENEDAITRIKASDLFIEYDKNETESNKIYLDKTIEVKGFISDIDISNSKNPVVIFKNAEDFFGVNCSFNVKMKQLLLTKKIGDSLTVKGICKGYLSDVVMIDCIIIE